MRQKWKAARELKRAGLFIREVYSDLCRFLSRKFGVFYFIWKRAVQGAESCHLFVVLRGLEVPRGLGGRDVQFYLYMVEFCVSLQTPNLTSSI